MVFIIRDTMVEQFQNLLAFFGVTGVPQNFGELVPWLVTVLACMAIFWGALKLMFGIVRTMSRWR